MNIKNYKLKDLIPADYNPRKALKPGDPEYESLKKSILEFGLVAPLIRNTRTGKLVGGHQRLSVLKDLKVKEVPCVDVDLDVAHEKALNVALNKITGVWDYAKLTSLFDSLDNADFDLSLTGFSEREIDNMFRDVLEDGAHEDDFDVDTELEKPKFSKPGDLWLLGRHRLFCGDSTKPDYLKALMGRKKANCIITDPPYNVDYTGSVHADGSKSAKSGIKNDKMSDSRFLAFLTDAFQNAYKAAADDASIYIFHSEVEGVNFRQAMKDAGFTYGTCCLWNKNNFTLGGSPYQKKHEPCLFGWKKSFKWYAGSPQTTIWNIDKPVKNDVHPTMKPIALLTILILNSTLSNCIVLDPFGGSGSTLIACEQTGRVCFTNELDEKYCDVIVNRYLEQIGGDTSKVRVMRDGVELSYEEVQVNG